MCKNVKPASALIKDIYTLIRKVGIKAEILPKNFPTVNKIEFGTIDDKKTNFSGFGGAMDMSVKGKYIRPFMIINKAFVSTLSEYQETIAHEMLHIKQTLCDQIEPHHGNTFRTETARFAKILGITYWHVNGYDKPTLAIFKAKQAKNMRKFLADHGERKINKILKKSSKK